MLRTEQHAARNLDRNELDHVAPDFPDRAIASTNSDRPRRAAPSLDHIIAVNEPQVFSEEQED
jgi:hypothetical protein